MMNANASTARLAHHFDTPEQQFDAARLGMWLFLATEVLFFGGLFAGYTVYRMLYPDAFSEASGHLDLVLGTLNTAVLLLSSLSMALAVHAAQTSGKRLLTYILVTALLGTVFLGVKAVEYYHKFHDGLIPGAMFGAEGHGPALPAEGELFFSFYFAMTGLHALHMLVGLGLLAWIARLAVAERLSAEYFTPVEMVGLYWHFVDIVWVFLFPLLYLIA